MSNMTPFVLYHTHVIFSLSCPSIYSTSHPSSFLRHVLSPEGITRISFGSVIYILGSQLASWPGGIVNHYILKTSILHYRVASYIPSSSPVWFTTLFNFNHHLHRLHHSRTTICTLISRMKACTYHVTCFSDEHQSCHYFNYCDKLILYSYVSQQ